MASIGALLSSSQGLNFAGLDGSDGSSDSSTDFNALFDQLGGSQSDADATASSQSATAADSLAGGDYDSAMDNDIYGEIAAGDPALAAKFKAAMKKGDRSTILNCIQNALHEGLISKDEASQFMQQPDMEKLFKGSHMATKKGYEDVVNEDDSRGFDGGKGGKDLLKAGDKYDLQQVLKVLVPIISIIAAPLMALGAGAAVEGALGAVAGGVGAAVDGAVDAASSTAIGASIADGLGGAADAAAGAADAVTGAVAPVADAASEALAPVTDAINTASGISKDVLDQALLKTANELSVSPQELTQMIQDGGDLADFGEQVGSNVHAAMQLADEFNPNN